MPTLKITDDNVIMRKDGETHYVERARYPRSYELAREASLRADFDEIERLSLFPVEDVEDDPVRDVLQFDNVEQMAGCIRDMLDDEIITPADLGFHKVGTSAETEGHEHDLSNWNGSPIFYPTAEMAIEQAEKSYGFWSYHDFGGDAPNGYRYATVPNSVGPYAPEGYDWVCLRRTNTGR